MWMPFVWSLCVWADLENHTIHTSVKKFNHWAPCGLKYFSIPFKITYFRLSHSFRYIRQLSSLHLLDTAILAFRQPRQHIKKQRHYFANKGLSSQGNGFSSSHVWMWELDYKESWMLKNWCFLTVVLENTLKSPLDCKEIQLVHPKEDQSWVFTGRTDVEAETPILWPPDVKSWLIWKDPDARKDWGQEEKETIEDEMVGWHHWLNGHGFE